MGIGGPDGSAVRQMEHEASSVSKQLAAHPHTKALFKKIENATAEANRRAEASAKQLKESEKAVADGDSPSRQLGAALQQSMVDNLKVKTKDTYAIENEHKAIEAIKEHKDITAEAETADAVLTNKLKTEDAEKLLIKRSDDANKTAVTQPPKKKTTTAKKPKKKATAKKLKKKTKAKKADVREKKDERKM